MEAIKQEFPLAALRLSSGLGSDPPSVSCAIEVARKTIDEWTEPAAALGLPAIIADARTTPYDEPEFRLSTMGASRIAEGLRKAGVPNDDPLWVEIDSPFGTIPTAPWERMLQDALDRPVLRLSYFALTPTPAIMPVDVMLCASTPMAKSPIPTVEILASLARSISKCEKAPTRIHVFTDLATATTLKRLLAGIPGAIVYDPAKAVNFDETRSGGTEDTGRVRNAWLRWAVAELKEINLDVAYFVGHGYLTARNGALAVSPSPLHDEDENWSRFIGPNELAGFLERTGAATAAIGIAPHNYSAMGLRFLAHGVSMARPGAVVVQDLGVKDESAIARVIDFLYGGGPVPRSPAISLGCHPSVWRPDAADRRCADLQNQCTPIDARKRTSPVPRWVMAGQRYLERSVADLRRSQTDETNPSPRQAGVKQALNYISELLKRHAEPGGKGKP